MTEAELLAAIVAAPEDDAPRLVYADWLMERGDPRGELVSLQCSIAQLPADDPGRLALEARVQQLVEQHEKAWLGELGVEQVQWQRGMIEHLVLEAAVLLERGDRLLGLAPLVRSLHVREVGDRLAALLDSPWIGRLRGLDLSLEHLGDDAARRLADGPLSRLESLELGGNAITDAGVAILAGSPQLSGLVYLGLETNQVEDDGAVALGESTTLTSLRELDLREVSYGKMWDDNCIDERGGVALARLPLTRLWLSGNPTGSATLEALAADGAPGQLVDLDVTATGVTDRGVVGLAISPKMANLRQLGLSANPIREPAVQALLASPHLSQDLELTLHPWKTYPPWPPNLVRALRRRFRKVDL